jgi:hypothetical protein
MIERFTSMSNFRHDVIVDAIEFIILLLCQHVKLRSPNHNSACPPCVRPMDLLQNSTVKIDANIAAGYMTNGLVSCAFEISEAVVCRWENFY